MAKFGKIEILTTIKELAKELSTGLRNLRFEDNFDSFLVDLSLAAGEERNNIRNELKNKPTKYIIEYQTGNGLVTAGTTPWNANYISFINNGAAAVQVKIRVFR